MEEEEDEEKEERGGKRGGRGGHSGSGYGVVRGGHAHQVTLNFH